MQILENEDRPGLILSLDFEKAFDRVEMVALVGTLKYFNFGEYFINGILLLYKDFETCPYNMGYTSIWFKPSCGLHQGCCASSILFILIVEVLVQEIRDNSQIKGSRTEVEYKSVQFADDTNLFLDYDPTLLQITIDTLAYFEKNSGLRLNYEKSSVFRIGSLRYSNEKLYQ